MAQTASGSWDDVNAAVNGGTDSKGTVWTKAAPGAVITVPAGTWPWSKTLNITVNITLQGQTRIFKGAGERTYSENDSTLQTVIMDNSTGPELFVMNFASGGPNPRLSGFTIDGSPNIRLSTSGNPIVSLTSANKNVRIDNMRWKNNDYHYAFKIEFPTSVCGVMDHCWSTQPAQQPGRTTSRGTEMFSINNGGSWPGDFTNNTEGYGSWESANTMGGPLAWVIEDCRFESSGTNANGNLDGQRGMRRVVRHCHLLQTKTNNHGTEASRGARQDEIYNNCYEYPAGATALSLFGNRAGTQLIYNNQWITNGGAAAGVNTYIYRENTSTSNFGAANGANPLDQNNLVGGIGTNPKLYYQGTIFAIVGVPPQTIELSDSALNADWTGYSVSASVPPGQSGSTISFTSPSANTANVAFVTGSSINAAGHAVLAVSAVNNRNSPPWAANRPVSIFKLARSALDQPGMGRIIDALPNDFPNLTTDPRPVKQEAEPLYSWGNTNSTTGAGGTFNNFTAVYKNSSSDPYVTILPDRDFYNWNTSAGAVWTAGTALTKGVAVGPTASQPPAASSTPGGINASTGNPEPGVGFWDTTRKVLQVLKKIGTVNTWVDYYTPTLAYPHILQSGGGTPFIDSANSTSFTVGSATNSFTFTTQNFTLPLTSFTLSAWTPSISGTVYSFTPNLTNGTAVLTGLFTGVTPGQYTATATASKTSPSQNYAQLFTLTVQAAVTNQPPTVTMTGPTQLNYTAPATIDLTAVGTDSDPGDFIQSISYYYGGTTLIGTADSTTNFVYTWTNVVAGPYSLTAKAMDSHGGISPASTPPIVISVTQPLATLPGPTIVVSATRPDEPPGTQAVDQFGFAYPNLDGSFTATQYVANFSGAQHNPNVYRNWITAGKDIRLLNPNGMYLTHINVRTIDATYELSEGHPTYTYIHANHPEWIIRNNLGNTVPLFRSSEESMDFGNSAYLDWVWGTWFPNTYADSTMQNVALTFYEHDNGQIKGMASQFGLQCAVGDTVCQQYLTDAGVQTAFKNMFDKFHQWQPTRKIFLSSGLASETQGDLAGLEDVLTHADGYYSEYLTNDLAYWQSGTNASKRTILNNTMLLADWCAANDKYFFPVLGQSDVAQPTQAQVNYGYAFFNLLKQSNKFIFGFIQINVGGLWVPAVLPEMTKALGDPSETRQQISTNVWRRQFANGIAYVNISDASTSITLPAGTWKNSLGATVASPLVLPSFSGLTIYA